jgi:hypothetical protein
MNFVNNWAGWEVIFIHSLTGILFGGGVVIVLTNVGLGTWWLFVILVPLFFFSAWGWLAEARRMFKATAWLRRGGNKP